MYQKFKLCDPDVSLQKCISCTQACTFDFLSKNHVFSNTDFQAVEVLLLSVLNKWDFYFWNQALLRTLLMESIDVVMGVINLCITVCQIETKMCSVAHHYYDRFTAQNSNPYLLFTCKVHVFIQNVTLLL